MSKFLFQRGHKIRPKTIWNKGKKFSLEYRKKLSDAHKGYKLPKAQKIKIGLAIKGRKHSPEAIERMRAAQANRSDTWRRNIAKGKEGPKNPLYGKKGPLAPQWKGGITPKNIAIRNSRKFQTWRKKVFKRDNYSCRGCGMKGGVLHAHHILAFSRFPKQRFVIKNGLTLCQDCHRKTDNYAGRA